MADGKEYRATYDERAEVLGLDGYDGPGLKLQDFSSSKKGELLAPLYPAGTTKFELGVASNMLPKYFHMHKILRPVFIGKAGEKGKMWDYAVNLMLNMAESGKFHIFDYIFKEIRRASTARRSLPSAPFIQALIETFATHLGNVNLETKHTSYTIHVGELDKARLAMEKNKGPMGTT